MKENIKILGIIILCIVAVLIFKNINPTVEKSLGNSDTSHYSTTTQSGFTDLSVLKTGYGTLGSFIITIAGTASMSFYDATTSDVTKRTGNKATTTILMATIPASPTVGTYIYNSVFTDGLLIDFGSGTLSTTTITWN